MSWGAGLRFFVAISCALQSLLFSLAPRFIFSRIFLAKLLRFSSLLGRFRSQGVRNLKVVQPPYLGLRSFSPPFTKNSGSRICLCLRNFPLLESFMGPRALLELSLLDLVERDSSQAFHSNISLMATFIAVLPRFARGREILKQSNIIY